MIFGDLEYEEEPFLRSGMKVYKGAELYKLPIRAVTCPNSVLVMIVPNDMWKAYNDLQTWKLPIVQNAINQ